MRALWERPAVPTVISPRAARRGLCPTTGVTMAALLAACAGLLAYGPAPAGAATCTLGQVTPSAERNMLRRINAERRAQGHRPVRHSVRLRALGRHSSIRMARGAAFQHGSLSWARGAPAGQNLAWAFSVPSAVGAMMNSTGHRRNMLDRRWRSVGIGGARDCRGQIVFTINFSARPRG
jgi:uncharacterized protein YkwD